MKIGDLFLLLLDLLIWLAVMRALIYGAAFLE